LGTECGGAAACLAQAMEVGGSVEEFPRRAWESWMNEEKIGEGARGDPLLSEVN